MLPLFPDLPTPTEEREENGELFPATPRTLAEQVAEVCERAARLERAAARKPDDEALARRAAQARKDCLAARGFRGAMSADEVAAQAAAAAPSVRSVAQTYIRSIRNARKQEYARRYLAHLMDDAPKPEPEGITTVAAQAVRLNLLDILRTGRRRGLMEGP